MTNLNTIAKEELDGSQKQLVDQVNKIVKEIESGEYEFDQGDLEAHGYDEPCGAHYLENVLDINYLANRDKTYKAARILVAFGGPNIWIDTFTKEVQGYWGGDVYNTLEVILKISSA